VRYDPSLVIPLTLGAFMRIFCVLCVLCLVSCKSDPTTPQHWDKRIANARGKKEKVKAVEELRAKYMTPAMIPMLTKALGNEKSTEVKASIARALGETKSLEAVGPLIEAIDPAPNDSDAKAMNKEIATALGTIGDKKAVPALAKLLRAKDNYTVIAAIESVGTLKAQEAFEPLYDLANDESIEPFVTKKAVVALGELGDARAVPGLVKLMFREPKGRGISFYMESSFALYQIGQPAADALVPVVQQKDKGLIEWANKNGTKDVALFAKATQVLGDLHETRSEKELIGFLNFKSEFDDIKLIMRMRAADALGRMRSQEAATALGLMLEETDAVARREYVWSLARIGNKESLKPLLESAGDGTWDARSESMRGVAMLADDASVFNKLSAAEAKLTDEECQEDAENPDCKNLPARIKGHLEKMTLYKKRVTVAAQCKGDATCWAEKLDDTDEGIRERAAYEVGRSGNAALINDLMKRLTEKNLDTRLAIIQGADWLVHDSKAALTEAKKYLPALTQQIAQEKGRTEFVKVNEDLRRLAVKIAR
jgi:HEAT repeat protein